jgi:hypothetical protein
VSGRLNIGLVVIRADRRWCEDHAADATPAEHLNTIIRAVEDHVGLGATDQMRAELANTKALLGKLVTAVRGSWDPDASHSRQVTEALGQLRAVERFLKSLNTTEKGAA